MGLGKRWKKETKGMTIEERTGIRKEKISNSYVSCIPLLLSYVNF